MTGGYLDEPNNNYNITLFQKDLLNGKLIYRVYNVSISNGSTIVNKMNYYYTLLVGDGQHPCFHFGYLSGKMYVFNKGPQNVQRYNDWVLSLVNINLQNTTSTNSTNSTNSTINSTQIQT